MSKLMKAVNANDVGQVRELIKQSANVSELDANGDAPIVMAAYKGFTDVLRLLLEAGADVTAVDPGRKATALHAAVWQNNIETAKVLIDGGADLRIKSHAGNPPLDFARSKGHKGIVALLEKKPTGPKQPCHSLRR